MRMRCPGEVAVMDEEVEMARPAEVWAVGSTYDAYVGRWSRLVARELIAWLEVAGGAAWLDVGCGTGALSQTLLEAADPAEVVGLDPAAAALDEGRRFPICRPEPLAGLFRDSGLAEVEVRPIEVPTRFRDFDDYWTPFLGGQGPAPGYAMALEEPRRAALREELRARMPVAPDGSIPLVARAWAARGVAGPGPRPRAGGGGPWTA
jgi:SAM-dependent methyltransferase